MVALRLINAENKWSYKSVAIIKSHRLILFLDASSWQATLKNLLNPTIMVFKETYRGALIGLSVGWNDRVIWSHFVPNKNEIWYSSHPHHWDYERWNIVIFSLSTRVITKFLMLISLAKVVTRTLCHQFATYKLLQNYWLWILFTIRVKLFEILQTREAKKSSNSLSGLGRDTAKRIGSIIGQW